MKIILKRFFILISLASCKQLKNDADIKKEEIVPFDSIYYFMLNRAYIEKDTFLLKSFFEAWYKESLRIEHANHKDPTTQSVYDVFNTMYHPFDHAKYNWIFNIAPSEYVILPSTIIYEITDSLFTKVLESDTIKNFQPTPDVNGAKKLFDIDPFKKSMEIFLSKDKEAKWSYIGMDNLINLPFYKSSYLTEPRISIIKFNKEKTKALVDISIMQSGMDVYLEYSDNNWAITEVEQIWIE